MNKRNYINHSALFWLLLFIPLIAAVAGQHGASGKPEQQTRQPSPTLPELIYQSSEHFSDIDSADLSGLLERIGDSRVVLIGEATHGTAEFYDMRARITRDLIEKKGFNIVAVEADWPDATSINHLIHRTAHNPGKKPVFTNEPFSGFPSWMWANHSVSAFTHWLKGYNQRFNSAEQSVGFYGLDLYNMLGSIEAVLDYLQDVDPKVAETARWHYGCLLPWADDPSKYNRIVQSGRHRGCDYEVHAVMQTLRKKHSTDRQAIRQTGTELDRHQYFNAVQNARLVINAERYYRTLYQTKSDSWNQRDYNMFESLMEILKHSGQTSKVVVWAHNSHIGDSRATELSSHGEFNLGQLAREAFGNKAYLIGFGTDHGTVTAASRWSGPTKTMQVQPSLPGSYERLFHQVKADNFLLPLRKSESLNPVQEITRNRLLKKRLQRAIGTTYDPEDELNKHYIYASLPRQFDEYIWIDKTHAVKPLTDN